MHEYRVKHVGNLTTADLEVELNRMSREFGWRFVAWHPSFAAVAIYERPVNED